jgi:hypothetical protein
LHTLYDKLRFNGRNPFFFKEFKQVFPKSDESKIESLEVVKCLIDYFVIFDDFNTFDLVRISHAVDGP